MYVYLCRDTGSRLKALKQKRLAEFLWNISGTRPMTDNNKDHLGDMEAKTGNTYSESITLVINTVASREKYELFISILWLLHTVGTSFYY